MRTRIQSGSEAPAVRRPGPDAPVVLGRYRLRRRLGTGAFATVWLAHDERLDRHVAVKILPRERVLGGRFEREARAAARLAHPGIVTLYEAAVDDEGAYLVSELVRGATLEKLLAAGRLSDRDVLQIGIALCDALTHAHGHGVIHRDVKPSNVLVPDRPTTSAQVARLTDFGVARVVGGDSLTRPGDVIGTAAYMAPEQAQGLPAGAAADLFSLALVLYEALSGVNPLRSAPGARRSGMHLPPLRRQRRDLPRELGRAVDLALRPRPAERGKIEELRATLAASAPGVDDAPGVVGDRWLARTHEAPALDPEEAEDEDDAASRDAGPGGVPRLLAAALPTAGWLAISALATAMLAALGLATAWPALAGVTGRPRRRAVLGATGAAWTVLWAPGTAHAALTVGTLAVCGVWASAAVSLPWTRSRRWPALEAVRLALWAIALGLATALAGHLGAHGPVAAPGAALLGAFAGALVAVVTRRLTTRRKGHQIDERSRSDRVPSR